MADTELARELSAIINSPYPVALATLASVCAQTDALTVRACLRQHPPCAIAKLASSLYDALPVWQCCVSILYTLSLSLEFKNELLSHKPGLLDALLNKANSSQHHFEQYHGLCIQLLADPLPEAVPLPASVQPFFLRVFEQAFHKPNVQSLQPVYCMLKGACRGFTSLLPFDARQLLDEQLSHILKEKVAPENFMLLLWCFGVAVLVEHPELIDNCHAASDRGRNDTDAPVAWVTAAGRKIFGSPSACKKTINLACISVIWAIRDSSGVSDDEALQGIRIATRALQLVDQKLIEQYALAEQKTTLSKLWEKIQQCEAKPAIQREALCFYAVVAGSSRLSPPIVEAYEAVLVSGRGWIDVDNHHSLSISLPLFADRMQKDSVRSLLSELLTASHSPTDMEQTQEATVLIKEVAATASRHATFRSHILTALSDPEAQAKLEAFLVFCNADQEETHASFCPSHSNMVQQQYIASTISMLLTVILAAGADGSDSVPSQLGLSLVEKQCNLTKPVKQCTHMQTGSRYASVSLFEQGCTPISGAALQDWRGRLRNEMKHQATYQQDSLIRAVSQICHDLESRCETVEGPLRSEREKTAALTEELSQSRACVESLEQKRLDDSLFLGTLEAEKCRLEKDNEDLTARLENLRAELERSNEQADIALHEAEEAYNHKEMHLRTVIVRHEEAIEVHQKENSTLRERAATLGDELAEQEARIQAMADQKNDLQDRLKKEQGVVETQQEAAAQLEDRCNNLQSLQRQVESERDEIKQTALQAEEELIKSRSTVADLQRDLQQSRLDLKATTERLEDLQVRHHELAQSSTKALQDVEAQCEDDLTAAASKAAEERLLLQEACDVAQQKLEQLQGLVLRLQLRVQAREQECLAKDRELERFRAWKNNVINTFMEPSREALPTRRVSEVTGQLHDAQSEPNQDIADEALDELAEASFTMGSTPPKRARLRNSTRKPSREAVGTRRISEVTYDAQSELNQGATDEVLDELAEASFTMGSTPPKRANELVDAYFSMGSTPSKRARLNLMRNSAGPTSSITHSKRDKTHRSALGVISPNRRHTTVGVTVVGRKNGKDRPSLPLSKHRGSQQEQEATGIDTVFAEDSMTEL